MKPIGQSSRRGDSLGRRAAIMLALNLVAAAVAAITAPQPQLDQIREMQRVVETEGLIAFSTTIAAHHWTAPIIPSAWYLTNTCPPDQRPLGQAAREFGSALLTALDAWAPQMQTDRGDALLERSQTLLALAAWVGATEGYGNLFLAVRARDLALPGFARLGVDLQYPLEKVKALAPSCRTLHPEPYDSKAATARILNFEAGAAVFPTDLAVSPEALNDTWQRGVIKLDMVEGPEIPPDSPSGAYLEESVRRMFGKSIAELRRAGLGPHDKFFRDDRGPHPLPATTRNYWDGKHHQRLMVLGGCPGEIGSIEGFIRFRERIGGFPTRNPLDPLSRDEEAFRDALNAQTPPPSFEERSANTSLASVAWHAFDLVRKGEFLDRDSAEIRRQEVERELRRRAQSQAQGTATAHPAHPTPTWTENGG